MEPSLGSLVAHLEIPGSDPSGAFDTHTFVRIVLLMHELLPLN